MGTTTKAKTSQGKKRVTSEIKDFQKLQSAMFDRKSKITIPAVTPDFSKGPMPKRKTPKPGPKPKTQVGMVINPEHIDQAGKKIAKKLRGK